MSILTDLVLLPFGLALEIVNMVLWIVSTVCEAAFSLIFDLVWFSMSTLEFMLEYTLIIVGHALFEWLPMLIRLLYRIVLYTAPIVRQFMEAIFQILASAWMFVYGLPWRATFVKVGFHLMGLYIVRSLALSSTRELHCERSVQNKLWCHLQVHFGDICTPHFCWYCHLCADFAETAEKQKQKKEVQRRTEKENFSYEEEEVSY